MGLTQQQIRDAVFEDVGEDLAELLSNERIDRWANRGKDRLGPRYRRTATLTWTLAATSVALPADIVKIDDVIANTATSFVPPYRVFGDALHFLDPDGADKAGGALLFYLAYYPDITDTAAFIGDANEGQSIVSYVLYKFYRWLASSAASYNRYATITGQNGVKLDDLENVALRHLDDSNEARDSDPLGPPDTYYGD